MGKKGVSKSVICVTVSVTQLYKGVLNNGDWLLSPSSEFQDNRRAYDLDYSCLWERKLTNVVISRQTAGPHSLLLLLLPFPVYFFSLPPLILQTFLSIWSVPSVPVLYSLRAQIQTDRFSNVAWHLIIRWRGIRAGWMMLDRFLNTNTQNLVSKFI